ncbi:hypothetical protein [Mumia sp. Pv 4-285]|uniref:hypothetical protein n=1 Tax=Mumia qirimensis TaxID=3234852 RepID=UPI00351D230B
MTGDSVKLFGAISSIGLLSSGALVGGLLVAPPASAEVVNIAPVRHVTELSGATGIARDAAGNVYVANAGHGDIRVFAPTATGAAVPIRTLNASALSGVRGVDVDAYGYVYAATMSGTISVFEPGADGADAPRTFSSGPGAASAIDVTASRQIVVRKSTSIAVYSTAGVLQRSITAVPNGAALAVGPDGTIWAGAYERIVAYSRTAHGPATPVRDVKGSATGLVGRGEVNGIAVDVHGRVYATGFQHDAVRAYAAGVQGNDAPLKTLTGSATLLNGPVALAVAPDRRVFVTTTEMQQAWSEFRALLPAIAPVPPKPPVVAPVAKVPGKPSALKVKGARSAKKRTVRWKAPSSNGGATITRYRLVIKKGSKTLVAKSLAAGKRSYTVKRSKLRKGKHVVLVTAKNRVGYGAATRKAFTVRKP